MTLWTSLDQLFVNLTSTDLGATFDLIVFSSTGGVFAQGSGVTGQARRVRCEHARLTTRQTFNLSLPSPQLWSPSSPFLYNFTVTLASGDSFNSYFGVRTFSLPTATDAFC